MRRGVVGMCGPAPCEHGGNARGGLAGWFALTVPLGTA